MKKQDEWKDEIKWRSQNFYFHREKSAGDLRNYATGSRMHFHVGEFPEKLRYTVDLRTTIKHGIINIALARVPT